MNESTAGQADRRTNGQQIIIARSSIKKVDKKPSENQKPNPEDVTQGGIEREEIGRGIAVDGDM